MPNWVTNKIEAPEHVIRAMLNSEGRVDFNLVVPFPGPHGDWDGIYVDAETAAESVLGVQLSNSPLLAMLERSNRERINIKDMSEESFRQFVGMLENYRACGYLHSMDFSRKVWGTKWNACNSIASPEDGCCKFDTAWSCPSGALTKMSEQFPGDYITVIYADEDIGSNCGTFTLKAGQVVKQDIAPKWNRMTGAEKARWKSFACEVTGLSLEPDEED